MNTRQLIVIAAATVVAATLGLYFGRGNTNSLLGASPSVTQNFRGVATEAMLLDFVYQVKSLQGVTGVSVSAYDRSRMEATLTVYYNPREISPRQIKVLLINSRVLWERPRAT